MSINRTQIQNINTSNNPLLETLLCHNMSSFTSLDVSNNPKLKLLDCQNTSISNLDVSKNLELESLNCSSTQITHLDISNNSKLKELFFYETDIAEIDTSNNLALEEIDCHDSNIQVLDVSINTNLKELRVWNVELLGLHFGNNPTLYTNFSSPTQKPITIEGNTFNLLEQTNKNIDLSKVTITSNGTLDKNTGIVTVEDKTKDVIYEYDCGISQKGKETLEDADVVQIFASYEAGVAKLGEAKVGDKTAEYALKVTAKANGTNNKNEKPADGGAVKTGDSNHISGFVVAMLLSIAAIVGVVIFKKRTHR